MEIRVNSSGGSSLGPVSLESTNAQRPNESLDDKPIPLAEGKNFSRKELESAIQAINQLLGTNLSHVKFTLHEGLNEYYVQVVNDTTNEVIREIPSKRLMDSIAKMYEFIGLMVDEKV
jgi:flagellar protein FlaG